MGAFPCSYPHSICSMVFAPSDSRIRSSTSGRGQSPTISTPVSVTRMRNRSIFPSGSLSYSVGAIKSGSVGTKRYSAIQSSHHTHRGHDRCGLLTRHIPSTWNRHPTRRTPSIDELDRPERPDITCDHGQTAAGTDGISAHL